MGTNKFIYYGYQQINVKLQKQSSRKKDDPNYNKYVKWTIIISQDRVNQLGWKEGIDLVDEIKNNYLIISPLIKDQIKIKKEEILYEDFKNSIKNLLNRYPGGLNWSKIRDKLNYQQKFPNNKWVKRLEDDIDLKRIKRGEEMTWLLENNIIFTIGYEGFSIEDFIKKLKDSNIQQLIDVRELALSRKNGFSKGILSLKLKEAGILYKHIPELGSPKEIRHQLHQDWDYKRFFEEYKNHIKDIDVLGNISDIEGRAKRKKTVLLCFEKDPKTCHRSIIAEELVKRGWRINNL